MNAVFLDTVGLIALWDKADQWHHCAESVFLEVVRAGRPIITTTLVLFECGNAAARRPYRATVDDLRTWLASKDWLVPPSKDDLDEAWAAYRASGVGAAGIVDHVSFVVMRRLAISEAFSNDRHFQTAGFTTLF